LLQIKNGQTVYQHGISENVSGAMGNWTTECRLAKEFECQYCRSVFGKGFTSRATLPSNRDPYRWNV